MARKSRSPFIERTDGSDVVRTHLMRIKENMSNTGNTTLLHFSNETFAFRPDNDNYSVALKKKLKNETTKNQARDPGAATSPMGSNPTSNQFSTPKAEIKALRGVRRFKRESTESRNGIDAQFSSSLMH